ncbi:condensin complex subunit 3-like [Oppia nitens]|uniref:condensin complex subunit 3-like n=1 Tax=Oppia nitens TaxID=1686743 RepID=UPI0023DBAE41|nr:condensin complex subunit 3-like [Oppia nitens]
MTTTEEVMDANKMRTIFDNSQHLHKMQKCLQQIMDLYRKCESSDEWFSDFKAELRRDILFTLNCDPKSPYTKHTIEFVANFLRSFSAPKEVVNTDGDTTIIDDEMADLSANNNSDAENREPQDGDESQDELGMETFGSESFTRNKDRSMANTTIVTEEPTFADFVIKEHLIRFLNNKSTHIRYNCCLLIRKLFTELEDMDMEVYEKLKKALLERLRDKDKSIRSAAALALHRFQEVDKYKDMASDALKFHLKGDPDFRVRQSCLLALHPTLNSIDDFINATRDVKDIIRKTAFILIAEKFDIRNIGIDKRLEILKNGLNERHAAVKKVIEIKLLPNWVKTYNGDFTALLYALDIQTDPQLIERMFYLYFDFINKDVDESTGKTGFHKFIDDFRNRFLADFNLLTKEDLTVENSFLWHIIAKYCKDNEISVTLTINNERLMTDNEETDSQPIESNEETVDALDLIIPDLPHYCRYLSIFVKQILVQRYELHQLLEFEFILNQLLSMGELIEIGDEAQRQILRKCVNDILSDEDLFKRIHNYVPHVMKIFAQNTDTNIFLETTLEIIDVINSSSMEIDETPVPVEINPETIVEKLRQYEVEYAKLGYQIEKLKDNIEDTEQNDNFLSDKKAEMIAVIQANIDELKAKKEEVFNKRLNLSSAQPPPLQQTQQNNEKQNLTDDPIALQRCLQIFASCLEFGGFKSVNAVVYTLIERLVMPSIPNQEIIVRNLAVKCLGLSCLLSQDLAKKYFGLIVQVFNLDSELPQETALKCIFDILCFYGLSCFEEKSKSKNLNKSRNNTTVCKDDNKENNSIHNNSNSVDNSDDEEEDDNDNDRTVIVHNETNVLCSDSEDQNSDDEEQDEDKFINLFTDLLERNLVSELDSIRLITGQGIAKLFLLGRMYSPQLLSRLLIMWYDPDSGEELRQFLGVFLPIYSGVQMKANLKGENAFEECFVKTIETVYNEALNYVNLDNLINFLLQLLSYEGHKNLAKSIANQIITRFGANDLNDLLSNKYYLRILSVLNLNEMATHDIKEYKLLIKRIEKFVNKSKSRTKLTMNRLQTIKTKIDKQMDLIKLNSSRVSTIENFESLSLSQSMSQSSCDELSHIDETLLSIKS